MLISVIYWLTAVLILHSTVAYWQAVCEPPFKYITVNYSAAKYRNLQLKICLSNQEVLSVHLKDIRSEMITRYRLVSLHGKTSCMSQMDN